MPKYIGPDGYEYSLDEIKQLQTKTPSGVLGFAGRNLGQNSLDEYDQANALASAYNVFGTKSADEAAQLNESTRILGLEPGTLAGATREVTAAAHEVARVKINSPEDWVGFVKENPKTAAYLSNGQNMAMSHDDIKSLGETERTIRNTVRLNELSSKRAEIGLGLLEKGVGTKGLSQYEIEQLQAIETEMQALHGELPQSTWSKQGLLSGLIGMIGPIQTGAKYAAGGAAVGSVVPGVGTLAGAGYGFRVGMAKEFASTAMGNAYLDNLKKSGQTEAAQGAWTTGIGQAVLGSVQVGKWMKIPQTPGVQQLAMTAGEQALLGAGFTATDIAGRKVAERDASITKDDLEAIVKGGIDMVPIGMAMASPGYGIAALRKLGQLADESKTAQRAPVLYAQKVNADVEGSPLADTAISGREFLGYLQSLEKPGEAEMIISKIGVDGKAIAEAAATGGEVSVKAGNLIILDKQHREAIADFVRVGTEPSVAEVKAREKELQDIIKANREAQNNRVVKRFSSIAQDMGLADINVYASAEAKAKAEAERIIASRQLEEQSPSFQRKLFAAMDSAKKDIEANINSDPLYKASDRLFDLQLFGAKDVKELAQKYQDGKLTDEQRWRFEDIADEHKFSSGNELAEKIIKNKVKKEEIASRLEAAAEAYKQDNLGKAGEVETKANITEGAIEKASIEAESMRSMSRGEHKTLEAKYNERWRDAEAKLVAEIAALEQQAKDASILEKAKEKAKEKLLNQKSKFNEQINALKEKLSELREKAKEDKKQSDHESRLAREWIKSEQTSQRLARTAQITMKAAREEARRMISAKTIVELREMGEADWRKYFQKAQTSAREAERSYRKGLYNEASTWKDTELLNRTLAMEAMKAEKEIKQIDKVLKPFINRGLDFKNMPAEFVGQIDALLKDFGLSEREPVTVNGQPVPSLSSFVAMMRDEYHVVPIPDSILLGQPKNHNLLTLGEYRDLKVAITSIADKGRKYNRFLSAFKNQDINDAAAETKQSIESNIGTPYADNSQAGHGYKSALWEKIVDMTNILDKVIPSMVNTLTLCKYLDGNKDNGPMQRYFYNTLSRSEATKLRMSQEVKQKVDALFNAYYGSPKEAAKAHNERIYFEHLGRWFTREEVDGIGLNWGNEGNRDRVMKGFGWVDAEGKPDMSKVQPILDSMTKKQWDFYQSVWDFLDTFWPAIEKLEMEVAGEQPKKVEPSVIDTQHGQYSGGYYPIGYDPAKSVEAYRTMEQRNALYKQYSSAHAMTQHGHTKARAESVSRPLDLTMGVFFRHLENVVHDLAFREAIIDANRFLKRADTKTAIENAIGPNGYRMLDEWLKSVATDQGEAITSGEKFARWFRYRATFAAMALRVAMFPIDATGNFSNGVWEIGAGRMTSAMKEYALNYKAVNELVDNSEYMKHRSMIRERDLWDLSRKWYDKDSGLKNFAFATMAWSDQLISKPLWAETFKKALGEGNDKKTAIDIADNTVKRAIGSGSSLDLVGAQRGSEYKKLLSMYYSWASMMFNRMWLSSKTAEVEWQSGERLQAVGTMAKAMFFGWVVQGAIDATFREAMRNEENPDEEKQAKRMASRFISQPFSYVWIGRDVAQSITDYTAGFGRPEYKMSPIESNLNNILSTIPAMAKFSAGDIDETKFAEVVGRAGASLLPYPQQLNTWAFNFLDWINDNGEATWQDLVSRRVVKK